MKTKVRITKIALLAGTGLSGLPVLADELPAGGFVVHGSVGISRPTPGHMAIQQSSKNAIVAWQGFSVGKGASVEIQQPSSSSAILNRVTGNSMSNISGDITANGRVYLVNTNGIAIGPTGTVRTGSFVASTLDVSNDDFLSGQREFIGNGNSKAVSNHGVIDIGRGGYAALIGGRIENTGTVSVPLGRVGFGAGERVTLDFSGDGFLSVAMPSEGDGKEPLISNSGHVSADGGRVEIKAATARQAARQAINLSGVVEARSVSKRNGVIVLGGGSGGDISVTGRLDTSTHVSATLETSLTPRSRPVTGGSIDVTGADIVLAGARLDASGLDGGGNIRVGGDYQGGGDLPQSRTASIDAKTLISADALDSGDGGRVIVWSDELTTFDGTVSARGGPGGGDGGFAEISGKKRLAYSGLTTLSAQRGEFGTLLLDPFSVFIEDSLANENGSFESEGGPPERSVFTPEGSPSVISAQTLVENLEENDVVIRDSGATTSGVGGVTVGAELNWDAQTTLTLETTLTAPGIGEFGGSPNDIVIAAPITAPNGGLVLDATGTITTPDTWLDSQGNLKSGGKGDVDVGSFVLQNGSWEQVRDPLPTFNADDFRIVSGASFLRAEGGDGSAVAPYLMGDVFGLQGLDSLSSTGTENFALVRNIDAAGTVQWNAGAGFDPIGGVGQPFLGSFDGDGHTIENLKINRPAENSVGLFGEVGRNSATNIPLILPDIENIKLTNVDIKGGEDTGALVGKLTGNITNATVTGSVVGSNNVGGLAGTHIILPDNFVPIITITTASADVTVTGETSVGGLVGLNIGTINQAYAVGDVTGTENVGGLVGENGGFGRDGTTPLNSPIKETHAAGKVEGDTNVGGLVGLNTSGSTTSSFWNIDSTGQDLSAGGTGLEETVFESAELFPEEGTDWNFETDWAVPNSPPALFKLEPVVVATADDVQAVYGDTFELGGNFLGGPDTYLFGAAGDTLNDDAMFSVGGLQGGAPLPTATVGGLDGVGTYTITTVDTLVSSLGVEYEVRTGTIPGTLTVTPAPLTVTANDITKRVGDTLRFTGTEFTVRGLIPGDQIVRANLFSDGAAANAGLGLVFPVSLANLEGFGLVGVDGIANYSFRFLPGELTVTPVFGLPGFFCAGQSSSGMPTLLAGAPPPPATLCSTVSAFAAQDNFAVLNATARLGPDDDSVDLAQPPLGGGRIPNLPDDRIDPIVVAEQALEVIEDAAADLEEQIDSCQRSEPEDSAYLDCLSAELDAYADELDEVSIGLPEPLRGVSAVIRQTARRIAETETIEQAQQIVGELFEVLRVTTARFTQSTARAAVASTPLAVTYNKQADSMSSVLDSVEASLREREA